MIGVVIRRAKRPEPPPVVHRDAKPEKPPPKGWQGLRGAIAAEFKRCGVVDWEETRRER